jgi:SP family myo-inositol transporter-like MFS transporter 13
MQHHDADQPLLANDSNNRDDVLYESSDVSAEGIGSLFIWALTFAAGISGLLFGYEYDILQMQYH